MRLIDADKLFPDRNTEKGLAISQSQIANAETIEPQRWIPCGERLPKRGEIVLWCNKDGRVFTSAITYQTKTIFSVGKHHDVIAWMPLPEPYKTESDRESDNNDKQP